MTPNAMRLAPVGDTQLAIASDGPGGPGVGGGGARGARHGGGGAGGEGVGGLLERLPAGGGEVGFRGAGGARPLGADAVLARHVARGVARASLRPAAPGEDRGEQDEAGG